VLADIENLGLGNKDFMAAAIERTTGLHHDISRAARIAWVLARSEAAYHPPAMQPHVVIPELLGVVE
jgi:hypothetical protein